MGIMIDALVVGAGPSGLMMSGEFARHGLNVRTIDRQPNPPLHSKGLIIHARTLEIFHMLGLVEDALDQGRQMTGMTLYGDGSQLARLDFSSLETPYPFPLILEQRAVDHLLLEHLHRLGRKVERSIELELLQVHEHNVTAKIRSGDGSYETVEARYVIGCDGSGSSVRNLAGIPFEGIPYTDEFILADVTLDWEFPPSEGFSFMDGTGGGTLIVFPMPSEHRYRVVGVRKDDSNGDRPDSEEAILEELRHRVNALPVDVRLTEPTWVTALDLERRVVPSMRQGRIFLAGDAAHIHSPAGGQGMNIGMQDAFNLAWKLSAVLRGYARPELLDTYHAERHPNAKRVLRLTDMMTRNATARDNVAQWLRRTIPTTLLRDDINRCRIASHISQLQVHYRGSSLSCNGTEPGQRTPPAVSIGESLSAPRAGDRAPQAEFLREGKPVTLLDLVAEAAPARFLLAIYPAESDAAELWNSMAAFISRNGDAFYPIVIFQEGAFASEIEGAAVVYDDGDWASRYEADETCAWLIRPDGYIACRNQPFDLSRFSRYFERWCQPKLGAP